MKKFLVILSLCLLLTFTLSSCELADIIAGLLPPENPVCTEHVDANRDGKCDVCGEKVPCVEHVDANSDGKCDVCGEKVPCVEHVDANSDGKCDVCGEKVPCDEHIDENHDYVCDVCGDTLERPSYKVSFDTDGAGDIDDATVAERDKLTAPTEPEKAGYTFLGWFIGEDKYDFESEVLSELTLTAKWEVNKYTLTFGEGSVEVTYGQAIGELPAVPEIEGKTGKWTLDGIDITAETVYNWTESKSAEASYTDIYYTVTYRVNGTTQGTLSVKHGDLATSPEAQAVGKYYVSGWKLGGESYDFTTPVKSDIELDADLSLIDPSFLTEKGKGAYYLSDFNSQSVIYNASTIGINPWCNSAVNMSELSWGTVTNGYGSFTGLIIKNKSETPCYTGIQYALPESFDLTDGAQTIVVKISASGWHGGAANAFMLIKSGDTYINVNPYSVFYAGKEMTGDPTSLSGKNVIAVNYLAGYLVMDASAMVEAGITSIDAVVIGQQSGATGVSHVIDEIYYTVETEPEDFRVDFSTSNTTPGSYTTKDTEDGALEISGQAWGSQVTYTFDVSVDATKVSTLTFRFKSTGGSSAIAYLNGDKVYINLTSGDFKKSISTDDEGYTILVIDYALVLEKEPAATSISNIVFKCNNAQCAATFDYVIVEYAK